MRELMQAWISEMEEQYGIQIISVGWSSMMEDQYTAHLYKGFGDLPGKIVKEEKIKNMLYRYKEFDGVLYLHIETEEGQNDNN